MARTKEFNEDTVLEKAIDLFWSKGFNGTSAQDLVDKLQISRSSLYDTYGDKYSLFLMALRYYQKSRANAMIEFIDSSDDAEETIRHIFQVTVQESIQDKADRGCFMVNTTIEMAPHHKEIADMINENMQDVEDALFRAVKKGQDSGQFSSGNSARALARFLFNSISGIRVAAKSGVSKKIYDDIVRVSLSALKA